MHVIVMQAKKYVVYECYHAYVTVSEKRGHSAQNISTQRSTRVNFRKVYLVLRYLSFLLAQERERYMLYAGHHAFSKMRRK